MRKKDGGRRSFFTATQAAQKRLAEVDKLVETFTATQAAQKINQYKEFIMSDFTATQAAQKEVTA